MEFLDLHYPDRPSASEILFTDSGLDESSAPSPTLIDDVKDWLAEKLVGRKMSRFLFKTAEEYAPRFSELMQAGRSWIKLDALGVTDGMLIVGLSFSMEDCGCAPEDVFVNYSAHCAGRCNWRLRWQFV
jgi:hypothetical protein